MAKTEPEDESTTSSTHSNRPGDLLRNLPSYKSENFSRFSLESGGLRNAAVRKKFLLRNAVVRKKFELKFEMGKK
jgi:hypothetical protein